LRVGASGRRAGTRKGWKDVEGKVAAERDGATATSVQEKSGSPATGQPTVLVLDDDRDLSTLVTYILEAEGYRVRTAPDGRQGLEAIEREMPSLILLDMKMPVMDGWTFAREFRARYDARVPIVVLTAAEDAMKRARDVGAVDWVGKPFDLDVLIDVVGRYVGSSGG